MLDKANHDGGESTGTCWKRTMDFLHEAGLDPERCFFTNALMGIKEGSATGEMPSNSDYLSECEQYLFKQIEIVRPGGIISLGRTSKRLCRKVLKRYGLEIEIVNIMHPSARRINWGGSREEWVRFQAKKIRELLASLYSDPHIHIV
jgi:uracil-DNA glycosylase